MGIILTWVVISIAALVIDVITSSFFIAGFTVGGIFAIFAQMLGASIVLQILVFGLVSTAAVVAEYYWFRKKLKSSIPKTLRMEEEYIGKTLTVEEDIEERGRIKIGGIYWTAENTGDKVEKGDTVKIVGIKGNKLMIKK